MRKIYSLVLIAAGLLIGTNLWAQEPQEEQKPKVCKIGSTEYATLQEAIDDVPADDVPKTIEMIDDEDAGDIGDVNKYIISAQKNVNLDLNGHSIVGYSSTKGAGSALFKIEGKGTLTIYDGQNPTCDTLATLGMIDYKYMPTSGDCGNVTKSTIINSGTLNIKGGKIKLSTAWANAGNANYVVDMYAGSVCTVENGYIWSSVECFRTFASKPAITLNLKGGYYYGYYGLVFVQDPSGGVSGLQTINISGGNYVSDQLPLVRVYTTGGNNLDGTNINISGNPICNVSALQIQHTTFDQNASLDDLVSSLQTKYPQVFNITGGTYANEDYIIKAQHTVYNKETEEYLPSETPVATYHVLPTLLDGATLKDDPTKYLDGEETPDEERTYPDEITIVPLGQVEPTNKGDLISQSNDDRATTISQDIALDGGDELNAYHITVADGGVLTIPDGAVVKTGKGGVKVEQGGRINVQPGGTLIIGAYGCETEQINSIYAYSTAEKDAIIMFSPEALLRQNPQIVVKMASPARKEAATESYWWQAFGIPTTGNPNLGWSTAVQTQFFSYGTNDWVALGSKNQVNKPFAGYLLRNDAATEGTVYEMYGDLNSKEDATVSLTHNGWNFFANSYMAPMDLRAFFEHCYLGSGHDNRDIDGNVTIYNPTLPGYISYSIYEIMDGDDNVISSIAPMQAFFLFSNTSSQIDFKFKYEECVWEPFMEANSANAPRRSGVSSTKLNITVAAGEMKDQIKLYEADKFSAYYDNGADARKMMNPTFNIYANIDGIDAAIVASDNLNGTQLAFQAGNAVEYTMTFSNRNNDNFVLVDNANGAQVAMTDGATYTFVATPNETTENRFEIRKAGGVVTNLAEMKAAHAVKGIYTAAGQYVGKADRWNTLPAGMYIVDGVRMAK